MTLGTGSPTTARNSQPLPPPVVPGEAGTPRHRRMDFSGYLFLAPYLLLFGVFLLLPLAYGLWLSFMQYEMLSPDPPRFVGFDNYREAIWELHPDGTRGDARFWRALWATIRFVVMTSP